jgi:hypothetical protein
MKLLLKCVTLTLLVLFYNHRAKAQRYLADYDSSLFIRDTVRTVIKRMENLSFSGYIQPQFQVAESKGAPSYNGGNFSEFANSRFMLRRARVKLDYRVPSKNGGKLPIAVFTYQLDGTERGVVTRDMFIRLFEPSRQNFSFTMGLFARPFGYEVNLSSSVRETPERGRASQILMTSERDIGAMITYDPIHWKKQSPIKFDVGLFNGQGLSGSVEFDSFKDLISRLTLKPQHLSKAVSLSGGLSLLYGGWHQATKYRYEMGEANGNRLFQVDSNTSNIGSKAPRQYYGADVQLAYKHGWGKTELRGEYWKGKQSGTSISTTNPGTLLMVPTYVRNFDAAFLLLLQNIVNEHNELMIKLDWYDPNTNIAAKQIGKAGTNMTVGDIKFTTLGVGFSRYLNKNVRIIFYYDMVCNEKTLLTGFTNDIKDNVFTTRFHFSF